MDYKHYEIKTKLTPVRVSLVCPNKDCVMGILEATGEAFMSMPPQYAHKCTVCGHTEIIRGKKYPYIDYESADENQTNL